MSDQFTRRQEVRLSGSNLRLRNKVFAVRVVNLLLRHQPRPLL